MENDDALQFAPGNRTVSQFYSVAAYPDAVAAYHNPDGAPHCDDQLLRSR